MRRKWAQWLAVVTGLLVMALAALFAWLQQARH